MAHFLRDERITNLSISVNTLKQLSTAFIDRTNTINNNVSKNSEANKIAYLTYIIRFDDKGYRVFSLEDLLKYFHQAKEVERVIFTLETGESLQSNRQIGTYLELRLDKNDHVNCNLAVTSDDKDWVDASFSAIKDALINCKSKSGWVRTAWTVLAMQIAGVTLGFIISLWAAAKIAPKLTIENPFIITFLFALLIFSNTWTYLNQQVLWAFNKVFPNILFYRDDKERWHWLMVAIVGGIVAAIVIFILSQAFSLLLDFASGLVRKNP